MTEWLVYCGVFLTAQAPPSSQPASVPVDRVTAYADGIRMHWTRGIVELDGTVALRQGPLELFACSPRTKEHESIVVLHARPRQVFEAVGLIGLEPGAPATYDPQSDRWSPARGASLRIDVTATIDGRERTCGIHEWMRSAADGKTMLPRDWVFAGSRHLPDGRFAADSEGTLICVVDFDAALLALPESHSSDDAELWLEAQAERIPPRGTRCVVRISSADRGRTVVSIDARGAMTSEGRPITPEGIEDRVRRDLAGDPGANVLLRSASVDALPHAGRLRHALTQRGLTVFLESVPIASQPASQPASR